MHPARVQSLRAAHRRRTKDRSSFSRQLIIPLKPRHNFYYIRLLLPFAEKDAKMQKDLSRSLMAAMLEGMIHQHWTGRREIRFEQ
jgi:hypothetical protein